MKRKLPHDYAFDQRRLIAEIGRDVNWLLDAYNEMLNNAARGERHFLGKNIRCCLSLGGRIHRRRRKVLPLLRKLER